MFIMQNIQPRGNIMYISILDTRDDVVDTVALYSIVTWLQHNPSNKVHGLSLGNQRKFRDSQQIGNTGVYVSMQDAKIAQRHYLESKGYSHEAARRMVGI